MLRQRLTFGRQVMRALVGERIIPAFDTIKAPRIYNLAIYFYSVKIVYTHYLDTVFLLRSSVLVTLLPFSSVDLSIYLACLLKRNGRQHVWWSQYLFLTMVSPL